MKIKKKIIRLSKYVSLVEKTVFSKKKILHGSNNFFATHKGVSPTNAKSMISCDNYTKNGQFILRLR